MRSMNVNRIWMKRTTAWILALLLLLGLTAKPSMLSPT